MSTQYFYDIQNVFVATDFLAYATQALKEALFFAERTHAQVTLFHALERLTPEMREILFPYAALGCDEVDILEELRSEAQKRGQNYLEQLLGKQTDAIHLNVSFSRDSLAKSILYYASELDADLIYLGAYGTKPHTTGIIGSMASMLVAYTRVPLYLVKNPVKPVGHKKILVVLKESQTATALLAYAISFAMLFDSADLEVVSPIANLKLADATNCYEEYATPEFLVKKAQQIVEKRAKIAVQSQIIPLKYDEHSKSLSFRHHMPVSSIPAGILKTAEDIQADLIIMQSAQPNLSPENFDRDLIRSVTEYANQNVLLIPRTKLVHHDLNTATLKTQ